MSGLRKKACRKLRQATHDFINLELRHHHAIDTIFFIVFTVYAANITIIYEPANFLKEKFVIYRNFITETLSRSLIPIIIYARVTVSVAVISRPTVTLQVAVLSKRKCHADVIKTEKMRYTNIKTIRNAYELFYS